MSFDLYADLSWEKVKEGGTEFKVVSGTFLRFRSSSIALVWNRERKQWMVRIFILQQDFIVAVSTGQEQLPQQHLRHQQHHHQRRHRNNNNNNNNDQQQHSPSSLPLSSPSGLDEDLRQVP